MIKPDTLVGIINEIIKLTKEKKIEWKFNHDKTDEVNNLVTNITKEKTFYEEHYHSSNILNHKLKLQQDRYCPTHIILSIGKFKIYSDVILFKEYTSNPLEALYRLVTTGSADDPESISFERLLTEIKAISTEKQ